MRSSFANVVSYCKRIITSHQPETIGRVEDFQSGLLLNNMEGKKKPCSRLVVPNPTSGKSLSETRCWLPFSPVPHPSTSSTHSIDKYLFYSSLCTICQFNRQLKKKRKKKNF
ncbi:hypothetical protein CDAR_389541 [Caerostris darwini]|uniref:Uncharacterized protein n=1 Tax=Caerostris darwini TaxID=1538125 RepID=A0AAV4P4T5_9ARAC|nr:hypothetical protein CDAR_389541 [Caerostris darwini]